MEKSEEDAVDKVGVDEDDDNEEEEDIAVEREEERGHTPMTRLSSRYSSTRSASSGYGVRNVADEMLSLGIYLLTNWAGADQSLYMEEKPNELEGERKGKSW